VPSRRAFTSSSSEEKNGPVAKQESNGPDFELLRVLSLSTRDLKDEPTDPTIRTLFFFGGAIKWGTGGGWTRVEDGGGRYGERNGENGWYVVLDLA